ncbi:MAG: glycosyltransferase family 4 protein [Pseudomonadota bacterium]
MKTRPKKIGFYTEGPAFDGGTLDSRALGGSETALIQAARALADRGCEVTVFNNCEAPGTHRGVSYYPRPSFPRHAAAGFDVFIVSRFYGFFQVPFPAGMKVLWNHDTLDRPDGLRAVQDRVDLFFVLSDFQARNYLTRLPRLEPRLIVTRNGVDLDLINRAATGATRDQNTVMYASRPERGLKVLLENIWPEMIKARPNLTLRLCGYQGDPAACVPGLEKLYADIDLLVRTTPGVAPLGALAKHDYYRCLASSALMIYPCSFPEISCLAALEAQASGTPILTTDDFALSETVRTDFFKVPGRPGAPEYDREFISRALYLLDNREKTLAWAEKAREEVTALYSWDRIVAEWDRIFDLHLARRGPTPRKD